MSVWQLNPGPFLLGLSLKSVHRFLQISIRRTPLEVLVREPPHLAPLAINQDCRRVRYGLRSLPVPYSVRVDALQIPI